MKDRWEIIFSGVGGQGLIVSGSLIGEAAVLFGGKNATLTSSYGVETRGTFTKSDVIISDWEIHYPEVTKADIVLALAQVAYDQYAHALGGEALLIYDSSLVSEVKDSAARQVGYPITDTAREFGNVAVTNVIALGVIVKLSGVLSPESVIESIRYRFRNKPKVIEMNIDAFNRGMEIA